MLQEPLHSLYVVLHGSFAHSGDGGGNWLVLVMRKTVGGGPQQLDPVMRKTMGGGPQQLMTLMRL